MAEENTPLPYIVTHYIYT